MFLLLSTIVNDGGTWNSGAVFGGASINILNTQTYGIATYNLVSTYNVGKIRQLESFFLSKGYDIIILTETVNQPLDCTVYNFSMEDTRGVGILWRRDVPLSNIRLHPHGRLIAATLYDILIVGVYAPSGTALKARREALFAQELPL